MTALVLDGFDTYSGFQSGDALSLYDGGWVFQYTNLSASYVTYEFSPSHNEGRQILLANEVSHYVRIYREFAVSSEVCCGVLWTPYEQSAGNVGGSLNLIGLYSSDLLTYVKVSIKASTTSPLVFQSSANGAVSVDTSIIPTVNQRYYLEIELVGTQAKLYINGHLSATLELGTTLSVSKILLGGRNHSTTVTTKWGGYYDDCYVTDRQGAEHVGRLGPISIVPMNPVADGVVGNDFAAHPNTPGKYDKIDDFANSGVPDNDTTHIHALSDGAIQTVLCSSAADFVGDALAYMVTGAYKSDQASDNEVQLLASKGGSELASQSKMVPVGQYRLGITEVFTALPDGAAMTQANLETTEFGLRLVRNT